MSDDAPDLNPYAPPTDAPEGRRSRGKSRVPRDLREALKRLDEHLADASAAARDLRVAGPRFRPITWISGALFLPCLALIVLGLDKPRGAMLPIGAGLGVIAGMIAIIGLVLDLSLVVRGQPSSPEQALRSFLKAIAQGRFGYAWAALSPTAREQTVRTPSLGPVETAAGDFSMEQESGVKDYTGSFARAGQGQTRFMAVKRVRLAGGDGDVAEVEVELAFQSCPRWVTILTVVGFVLFRPLIIVGGILYFVMRKRHGATVTKTMLRGRNGAWYVYDADVLEGAPE